MLFTGVDELQKPSPGSHPLIITLCFFTEIKMDKLQNLAQRFEGFVANFFPDFGKIAVSSLGGLVDIKEAMEKNRPIISYQTIISPTEACLSQIEQISLNSTNEDLTVVVDNAKSILEFKKKVVESNSRAYKKFLSLYESMLMEVSNFNEKAEKLYDMDNAANLDPRNVLPNMYKVVRDFSDNMEIVTKNTKFLFYNERYYTEAAVQASEIRYPVVKEICQAVAEAHNATAIRLAEILDELDKAPNDVNRLKAVNELKLFGKRVDRDEDLELEGMLFKYLCYLTKNLLTNVSESVQIYTTMYQLAETVYTTKFVKTVILEEHRKTFATIRSTLDATGFSSHLEYFTNLFRIREDVAEEMVFLAKLLDIVLESASEDHKLFLNLYKDDVSVNADQIMGLISAFKLLKNTLTDSVEFLKVEKERTSLIQEFTEAFQDLENKHGDLSPRSKKEIFLKVYLKLSETILAHADLRDRAERSMVLFRTNKIMIPNILSYSPYLFESHDMLKNNHKKLMSRIIGLSRPPEDETIPVFGGVVPKAQAFREKLREDPGVDEEWMRNFRYELNFDPDEAYHINRTWRLHEALKVALETNLTSGMRNDITIVLIYTNTAKDLTWPNIDHLLNLYAGCFSGHSIKEDQHLLEFKEALNKFKKVLEIHMESCTRYDQKNATPKAVKFFAQRLDAERKTKIVMEQLMSMFLAADKLEAMCKKHKRVFDYAIEGYFVQLNSIAGALVELAKIAHECKEEAKSDQHRKFAEQLKITVDRIVETNLKFVGSDEINKFLHFVSIFRTLIDVNVLHVRLFSDLQNDVGLSVKEAMKNILDHSRLYIKIRQEQLLPRFQEMIDVPKPSMFEGFDKDSLFSIRKVIEENSEVFTLANEFVTENYTQTRTAGDREEASRIFSVKLFEMTKSMNSAIKKWGERLATVVLMNN